MSDRVTVLTSGGLSFDISLEHRPMSLGSQPGCDVRIDHEEVAGVAARLDYRGGCYLLQNCNPYEVYVGDSSVSPDQWAEWPSGQQLLLTRNVSLTLHSGNGTSLSPDSAEAERSEADTAEPKSTDAKKIIQLVVIAACLAFGVMMIVVGPSTEPTQPVEGFSTLIKDIDAQTELTQDDKVVRRYLQEARLMDIRYRRGNPKPIMHAYELLINHPTICQADFDEPTIRSRVKRYAEQRLETLGSSQ